MAMRIGLQQSVTIDVLERALASVFDGRYSLQYAGELAHLTTKGEARALKIRTVINKLTADNPMLPLLKEHKDEVLQSLRNNHDRGVVFIAITCAAFPFAYNVVNILGRYFHAQNEIQSSLLKSKVCAIYGSVRTVDIALLAITPMLMESNLIKRPKAGIYEINKQKNNSDFANWIYKKAFLYNNPNYSDHDDVEQNPFFEFIK